jgi:hypothetical protein
MRKRFKKNRKRTSAHFCYTVSPFDSRRDSCIVSGLRGISPHAWYTSRDKQWMEILMCSLNHAHCSLNHAHCSLNHAHCSLNHAHCSLNHAHCSLNHAHCNVWAAARSPPLPPLRSSSSPAACSSNRCTFRELLGNI